MGYTPQFVFPGAPMMAVDPSFVMATAPPKKSLSEPSLALMLSNCVQTPLRSRLLNVYAPPMPL